jgi:hypothetical protein
MNLKDILAKDAKFKLIIARRIHALKINLNYVLIINQVINVFASLASRAKIAKLMKMNV